MFQFVVLLVLFTLPQVMTGDQSRRLHFCSDARIIRKCASQKDAKRYEWNRAERRVSKQARLVLSSSQ